MIERESIRQMPLKSVQQLNGFSRDLGLSLSPWNEDLQHLWQLGILRADVVVSKEALEMGSVVYIDRSERGEHQYADVRECVSNSEGLANAVNDLGVMPEGIYLAFHPFRYYVVYRIQKELVPPISSFQILKSTTGCRRSLDQFIDAIQKRTASDKFRADVRRWNEITSLAVAVEPFTYSKVFGYYKSPHPDFKKEEEFFGDKAFSFQGVR